MSEAGYSQARTAMVLAAGLGLRMRPLTLATPKPLIRFAGKTLLDHGLDRLAASGVETAVVNVHYLPEQIEAHLAARQASGLRPATLVSDERDAVLDTGGGVKRALGLLGPGPFFIHNSDTVWRENGLPALSEMLSRWTPEAMDALLLLAPREGSLGYRGQGDFRLLDDGRLLRRAPDGPAPYVFAGVSLCDSALFAGSPEGAFSLNLLWDRAQAKKRLFGMVLDGEWMHIGTPEALEAAERQLTQAHG
jgi:N-acetyl-alpha-D-muramate 1-phosphate uridylyltransferase